MHLLFTGNFNQSAKRTHVMQSKYKIIRDYLVKKYFFKHQQNFQSMEATKQTTEKKGVVCLDLGTTNFR